MVASRWHGRCHGLSRAAFVRGLLAGNRDRGGQRRTVRSGTDPLADEMYDETDFDVVDAVRTIASERGLPPAQMALAWLLGNPAVSAPIVGATKLAHLDDAIAAVGVALRRNGAGSKRHTARTGSSATPDDETSHPTAAPQSRPSQPLEK